MGRGLMNDKKLAPCAVRMHGSGHGKNALRVLQFILKAVLGKFSFDRIAGAAHAAAFRASALDHKVFNNPVENEAVIKALLY